MSEKNTIFPRNVQKTINSRRRKITPVCVSRQQNWQKQIAVKLIKMDDLKKNIESVFLEIEELDIDKKRKACQKLHIQFGHARTERLHQLMKDAKIGV